MGLICGSYSRSSLRLSLYRGRTLRAISILCVFLVHLIVVHGSRAGPYYAIHHKGSIFFLSCVVVSFLYYLSMVRILPPFLLLFPSDRLFLLSLSSSRVYLFFLRLPKVCCL